MRCSSNAMARLGVLSLAAACAIAASCKADKAPAKGELMLSIQTDMQLPKDVSKVLIDVSVYGNKLFYNEYDVGPSGLRIPATLAIVAGKDPGTPVTIRVIALQAGKVRMLKEVVTTVPTDRIALLRVPIQWLCDGQAEEPAPQVYQSTCPVGKTCEAGACVSFTVDSSMLETYEPGMVYGGATGPGVDGKCLDTVACFSKGYLEAYDASDCSIAAPTGGKGVNVALVNKPGSDGICGPYACLVPFDQDPKWGFRQEGARIKLPAAACTLVQQGKSEGIAVTTACETKMPAIPTCGPWSSSTTPAEFDAAAPQPASEAGAGGSGGSGDGGVQDSSTGGGGSGGAGQGGSGGLADGGGPDADAADAGPFSCIGNLNWPTPGGPTYALQLWFQDAQSAAKLSGLSVNACPKTDHACGAPVDTGTTDGAGQVTLTVNAVPEGTSEFFEVKGAGIPTTLVYPVFADPSIYAGLQFTIPIVSTATLATMAQSAGTSVLSTYGQIAFTARDCLNQPAAGVSVTMSAGTDTSSVLAYWNGTILSTALTETNPTGQGAYFNIVPNNQVQIGVTGSINGGLSSMGTIPVWVRADAVTSINVVPWQ